MNIQCPCLYCVNFGWEKYSIPECPPDCGCMLDNWPSVCEDCDGSKCTEAGKVLCPYYVKVSCSFCEYYNDKKQICEREYSKYYGQTKKPTDTACNDIWRWK